MTPDDLLILSPFTSHTWHSLCVGPAAPVHLVDHWVHKTREPAFSLQVSTQLPAAVSMSPLDHTCPSEPQHLGPGDSVTHDQWTPASGLHSLSLGFLILKMRTVILPTSWGCQGTSEATRGWQHCSWNWLALLQHWYNNNYYHVIIFMFFPLLWSAALEFFIWVSGPHYASIIISYRNQQVSGWKSHSGLHEFKDTDQPYFLATFLF